MKMVKFFVEEGIDKLQLSVNEWLNENKSIGIIRADMQMVASTVTAVAQVFSFYILYEVIEAAAEVAVSAQMENIMGSEGITENDAGVQLQ